MDPTRTLVMACATVIEEMQPHMPEGMQSKVFDFGLHIHPDKLRTTLQAAIDEVSGQFDTIILGYGLCSQAVVGIRANGCSLVVPRVDDCIAIFLGSKAAYKEQSQKEPGTYYLTKGWIEVGDTPFSEYERMVPRFGREKADYIYQVLREYTKNTANKFKLYYDEIPGSDTLVRKMLFGPWDEEFVVLEPGETFTLEQFLPMDND